RRARGYSSLRVVHAELVAQRVADLADRAARPQRLAHRHEEVAVATRDVDHSGDRRVGLLRVSFCAYARRPLELPLLRRRIEAVQLDRLLLALGEPVDADDHALPGLHLLLPAECRLLDLVLDEAPLDGRDRAPELVDALDQLPCLRLELLRERLDEVRASERVRGVGAARL